MNPEICSTRKNPALVTITLNYLGRIILWSQCVPSRTYSSRRATLHRSGTKSLFDLSPPAPSAQSAQPTPLKTNRNTSSIRRQVYIESRESLSDTDCESHRLGGFNGASPPVPYRSIAEIDDGNVRHLHLEWHFMQSGAARQTPNPPTAIYSLWER